MLNTFLDFFLGNNPNLVVNAKAVHRGRSLKEELLNLLPTQKQIQEEATFDEVIKWFPEHSDHPDIDKGVVFRKPDSQGEVIIQVFLDKSDRVVRDAHGQVLGRKFVVKKIDDELLETFDNNNVIIVE
ncbi:MAG: hypothetical protein F6K22_24465 [Okeania sp. SIO2F4]|uniref:hypothetical protein n=1 Tax=Okeania sp. SIO2F4 TaxID=2607790 RepID=UPI00142A2E5A|nr:hypothetical protein [Okeania sp. SIO2F4]NES05686.1 hypothetical protein [Okeania sp. SIO2F4]